MEKYYITIGEGPVSFEIEANSKDDAENTAIVQFMDMMAGADTRMTNSFYSCKAEKDYDAKKEKEKVINYLLDVMARYLPEDEDIENAFDEFQILIRAYAAGRKVSVTTTSPGYIEPEDVESEIEAWEKYRNYPKLSDDEIAEITKQANDWFDEDDAVLDHSTECIDDAIRNFEEHHPEWTTDAISHKS